ncbi:hypothetical protein KYK29_20795 [Shinella daejeonensis]|uniref:hypothetical protein n=1 Tax=Shinella daejeonensis TaxID=659017 RepID=UPI0020C79F7A|nr:hypothetical protein [Shinella daejeonensis]MCP8897373.1 hypothetical protein [Shinella daejeonensis]
MPNTTVPAAGEAMPKVTEEQIALSHDVVSLLSVCSFVAERMTDDDGPNLAGDLARVLISGYHLARQVRDDLEMMRRISESVRA